MRHIGGRSSNVNHQKRLIVILMEQRHVIKFMQVKGLKLDEIAMELSNAYGRSASTPPSTNIGCIK
jgi:hypothetical protein